MQCKAEKQKLTKKNRPLNEEHRKRQERKKCERKRELEKRQRRRAFDAWANHVRDDSRLSGGIRIADGDL